MDDFGPACAALGLLALLVGAVALILRWLSHSHPAAAPGPLPPRCRNCAHTLPAADARCRVCGLLPADAEEVAELRITERRLRQLRIAGVIDGETFERIHVHLRRRREDLAEFPAAPTRPEPSEAILEVLPVEEPPPLAPAPVAHAAPALMPERRAEPNVPTAPAALPPPRRSLAHWLAAFMEERNILWGEIAGGLLMVGCSVALVLSLWKTLEQIPLFPFLVLAAITATLFGVGSYTLHHWKLEATSRGLLVIALLLVPLNFLVLAGLSPRDTGTPVEILIKVAGIALFAILTYRGSRNLFPTEAGASGWRRFASDGRLLMLAVLGISITPLPVPRLLEGAGPPGMALMMLSAWPVCCHAAGIGIGLRRRWNAEPGLRWLGFVGLATFPLALGLGFAVVWTASQGGNIELLLERLAPLIAVAAATVSAAGLLASRRSSEAKLPAVLGTIVALTGMLIQAAALVAAWPNPIAVIVVGALVFTGWAAAAVGFRLPIAHVVALPGLVAAFLAAMHLVLVGPVLGRAALLSGASGGALMGLAIALAIVADRLRRNYWSQGAVVAGGAAAVAAASLVLVGAAVVDGPMRAALVGLVAAGGCLALERRWGIATLGQVAFLLLPPTTLAALLALWPGHVAEWGTVLAAEAVLLSLARRNPLPAVALACLGTAGCFFAARNLGAPTHPLTLAAWAGVCVVQAQRLRSASAAWFGAGWLLVAVVVAFEDFVTWRMPASPVAVLLAHATLLLPVVFTRRAAWLNYVRPPLTLAVKIGCGAAGIGLVSGVARNVDWATMAAYSTWLSSLWLILATAERRSIWFTAHQATVALAVYFIVATVVRPFNFEHAFVRRFDLFGPPLVGLAVVWTTLRLWRPGHVLFHSSWPPLERLLAILFAGWIGLLGAANVLPAIWAEVLPAGQKSLLVVDVLTPSFRYWPEGSFLLVIALLVALAVNLRAVRTLSWVALVVAAVMVVGLTIPALVALRFEPQRASASALRWGLGVTCLAGAAVFWLRDEFIRFARRLGCRCDDATPAAAERVTAGLRIAFLAVTGGVALLVTLITMALVVAGRAPEGPAAGTLFERLGWTWSHGLPLGLVAVALVGHALRERHPVYALLGGLLTQLLVCGGFVVVVVTAGRPFVGDAWIILFQRFTGSAALWSIGWLVVGWRLGRFRTVERGEGRRLPSPVWNVQLALAIGGNIVTLALAALVLSVPSRPLLEGAKPASSYPAAMPWLAQVGGWAGWLALGLTVVASALRARLAGLRLSAPLVGFASLAAVVLLACPLADVNDGWGYRTLMLGWAGCALEWALLAGRRDERRGGTDVWAALSAALAVALALKAAFIHGDQRFAAASVALCSIGGIWLARRRQRDDWAFVGGLGVQVAVSLLVWHRYAAQPIGDWVVYLLQANAVAGAFVALDWLRMRSAWAPTATIFSRIQFAVPVICLTILALIPLPNLLLWPQELRRGPLFQVGEWTGWAALLAVMAAWWVYGKWQSREEPARVWPVFALLGGVSLACTVARWDGSRWLSYHAVPLTWAGAAVCLLAVFRTRAAGWATLLVALVTLLAVRAAGAAEWLRRVEAPLLAGFGLLLQLVHSLRAHDELDRRLMQVQAGSLAVALALSAVVAAADAEAVGRLLGPLAAALALAAAVLLTGRADEQAQRTLTYACLCLPVLLVAEVGWAFVASFTPAAWLHRVVAVALAFAVTTIGLSFGIARLKAGRWTEAAKQLGPILGLIGSAVLVMLIVQESILFDKVTKRTPLTYGESAAVGAALLGLMVAAISFAVRPAIDPFGLTDRWRKSYVYASECLLVLLFLHLRFNVPGLFPPVKAQAWAFIIMAISFAGVGVSELFRRWNQPVLAEPLQRTGVFLPLFPLLMFWLKPPAAVREQVGGLIPGAQPLFAFFDQIPTHFGTYALLWFLLGLLYATLAATRRSYWYALFAALAVNAGLWALLHDQSLAFREHPQLWLIPLALVVLASERYHRPALRPELSAGLRYLGLGLLYLSSTADLFIAGLGNSTALPLVLAVLAVAGVLLGILLRVKSYLFLGTGFLALVIFSMIWHAAVDRAQTWVWWACGIALGAAILALFAVFERRKQQVLNVVDEVRSWN